VGGGASLDMGKAIRLLVHHDPPLERYDDAQGGTGTSPRSSLPSSRCPPRQAPK